MYIPIHTIYTQTHNIYTIYTYTQYTNIYIHQNDMCLDLFTSEEHPKPQDQSMFRTRDGGQDWGGWRAGKKGDQRHGQRGGS